jgi:hypothetical protein
VADAARLDPLRRGRARDDAAAGAIRRAAVHDEGSAHVAATTACATYPEDGESLDELMRVADARLLAHKRARPEPTRPAS